MSNITSTDIAIAAVFIAVNLFLNIYLRLKLRHSYHNEWKGLIDVRWGINPNHPDYGHVAFLMVGPHSFAWIL